jgi:TldD protein
MEAALRQSDVEYTEIRIEDVESSWVTIRGKDLESVGSSRTVGGIARSLWKGGFGYATFNDLGDLSNRVRESSASARLVGKEKSYFAGSEPVQDSVQAELEIDFRGISLSDKVKLCEEYNRLVRGVDPKITSTSVVYRDSFRKVHYANPDGTYIEDERPDTVIFTTITARMANDVQFSFTGQVGPWGYGIAQGLHEKAEAAAKRAVDLLSASPVQGGSHTVVLNPTLTGVFAHEAFGHLSEADFVHENERMKEIMTLGRRFGPGGLNIVDDGTYPDQLGTIRYDDEGVPAERTYLIKEGALVGRLHSRETAARMGEPVTGNARAVAYPFPPLVRMTNTYIEPGKTSFEEMIKDIDLGVYALDMYGGQTNKELFTFSAGYGYMIRDGEVAELVRDVVLTGNVFDTMKNMDAFGDELGWGPTSACGKGGQSGLRTGIGGPHVRIRNVMVGGRSS